MRSCGLHELFYGGKRGEEDWIGYRVSGIGVNMET